MSDDLEEKLERLCERFGVSDPWRSLALSRFKDGRARYGRWNHLSMSPEELDEERAAEAADLLAFMLFIPWSRAYHSIRVDGEWIGLGEEDADAAINPDLIDAMLEALRLLSGGENSIPTHAAR